MNNASEPQSDQERSAKKNARKVILICILICIPIALWLISFTMSEGNISVHGKIALVLAVVLGLLSAILFMSITFFSSRSGADEQPNYREMVEAQRAEDENT